MAKYVPDSTTKRWVVIAPTRSNRPRDDGLSDKKIPFQPAVCPPDQTSGESPQYLHSAPRAIRVSMPDPSIHPASSCPFCVGNEFMTPPEVYRLGEGEPDTPGWMARVVPNKYPITDIHEVIIHGPSCSDDIEKLPVDHVAQILRVYRNRFRVHMSHGHVMIFCNHGVQAGASLKHPHSQLVVVPRQITLDALSREPIANIVEESEKFISYCPEFSQWPLETWIVPKIPSGTFADLHGEDLQALAPMLSGTLRRMEKAMAQPNTPISKKSTDPFVYNYYISHSDHWFIRITPRLIHRAGFELGTGLSVNILDPATAAELLRSV